MVAEKKRRVTGSGKIQMFGVQNLLRVKIAPLLVTSAMVTLTLGEHNSYT